MSTLDLSNNGEEKVKSEIVEAVGEIKMSLNKPPYEININSCRDGIQAELENGALGPQKRSHRDPIFIREVLERNLRTLLMRKPTLQENLSLESISEAVTKVLSDLERKGYLGDRKVREYVIPAHVVAQEEVFEEDVDDLGSASSSTVSSSGHPHAGRWVRAGFVSALIRREVRGAAAIAIAVALWGAAICLDETITPAYQNLLRIASLVAAVYGTVQLSGPKNSLNNGLIAAFVVGAFLFLPFSGMWETLWSSRSEQKTAAKTDSSSPVTAVDKPASSENVEAVKSSPNDQVTMRALQVIEKAMGIMEKDVNSHRLEEEKAEKALKEVDGRLKELEQKLANPPSRPTEVSAPKSVQKPRVVQSKPRTSAPRMQARQDEYLPPRPGFIRGNNGGALVDCPEKGDCIPARKRP